MKFIHFDCRLKSDDNEPFFEKSPKLKFLDVNCRMKVNEKEERLSDMKRSRVEMFGNVPNVASMLMAVECKIDRNASMVWLKP